MWKIRSKADITTNSSQFSDFLLHQYGSIGMLVGNRNTLNFYIARVIE